jgi:hypothetical protein
VVGTVLGSLFGFSKPLAILGTKLTRIGLSEANVVREALKSHPHLVKDWTNAIIKSAHQSVPQAAKNFAQLSNELQEVIPKKTLKSKKAPPTGLRVLSGGIK